MISKGRIVGETTSFPNATTTRQQRIAHEIYDTMDDHGNLQSGRRWTSDPRLHGVCAAWEVARAVGEECAAELEAVCDAGGY